MKKCVLCGKLFEPKTNAQRICSDKHYRNCMFCGNPFEIAKPSDSRKCCSKKCTVALREQTMLERYGVSHALQSPDFLAKSEATQLEKYGVKHAAQNKEVKEKSRQRFLDNYGVDTPFLMDDFQTKSKQTCLARYGVEYTSQIPGRTEKMQSTNLRKYGSEYPLGNEEIAEKVRQNMDFKYGVPYYCMTEDCRSKQKQTVSSFNKIVMSKLEDSGLRCIPELTLDRFSYDIYLPDLETVIEVNPTATHNAVCNPWSDKGLPKSYHRNKTKLARCRGYKCINIWDWDLVDKVVDILKPKVPIHARNCKIEVVDSKTAYTFENMYHLQGGVRGQKICLGLYYRGDLIQIMTFGTPRYNNNYSWELLRLCSNSKYAVSGGAEKLWAYFKEIYHPDSVISYCDVSKFSGEVYRRLGMKLDGLSDPNKIWSKGRDIITNNLLLQRGYDQIFGTDFGKGTDNEVLMLEHGWLPVYDCGQSRWTYSG